MGAAMSDERAITGQIVDAAMKVHSALGPGLLESAYAACMHYELRERSLHVEREVPLRIQYRGNVLDTAYRIDLLVEHRVVIELKTVPKVLPLHDAQLISYLKLGQYPVGMLLNFQTQHMRDGVHRYVHRL